ncbi:MAG: GCN5-related N-acetyltransferase [Acidimicrobiaceae bacterium]|jgi:GNAT superfamily N-acetyltransferase|nr:GCN5-related N-acetyltransferase [Acidimicrobiaceae bacterium]
MLDDAPGARIADLASPEVAPLVEAMAAFLDDLYGTRDRIPTVLEPDQFRPPGGAFVLVEVGDVPVACGGVRACGEGANIGELKRIWVEPHARGKGLARLLLERLEQEARALGYDELYLDTGPLQHEAMRLYETSGYRSIANYGARANSNFYRSYAKRLA